MDKGSFEIWRRLQKGVFFVFNLNVKFLSAQALLLVKEKKKKKEKELMFASFPECAHMLFYWDLYKLLLASHTLLRLFYYCSLFLQKTKYSNLCHDILWHFQIRTSGKFSVTVTAKLTMIFQCHIQPGHLQSFPFHFIFLSLPPSLSPSPT